MRRVPYALPIAAALVATTLSASPAVADQPAALPAGVAHPAENHVAPGYWTRARRDAAIDRDVLVVDAPGRRVPHPKPDKPGNGGGGGKGKGGGKGGGGGGGGGGGDTGAVGGATWTDDTALVQATVGKVYFTLGTTNYVCSGTAVDSPSGDLVLTAGHCVYDSSTGYATNFTFVPDHDPDGAGYGQWPAESLRTTTAWQAGDLEGDVGFAVVAEQGGASLADVVGGQAIGFDRPRGEFAYAFGYPAASPYRGNDLIHCAGTLRDDPFGASTQGMTCDMTGGSSGGGWLASFDTASGSGVLTSVNSYKYGYDSSTMYGPYFGSTARSLFQTAESSAG